MPVMIHPKLPGREITVRERAVPAYERSGWRVKNAPKRRRREPAADEDRPAESGE